jgi:hypothetical protein
MNHAERARISAYRQTLRAKSASLLPRPNEWLKPGSPLAHPK